MSFKCGIVGLPNVGKSTLFNALTNSSKAQAANFPFCTIDPNVGIVPVPDERLNNLAKISKSKKKLSFVWSMEEMTWDGAKWGREIIFPANPDFADILGDMDFDLEIFYFLYIFGIPNFWISRSPELQNLGRAWALGAG